MTGPDPAEYLWWLTARAGGIVALLAISVSVGLGLAMAARIAPGAGPRLVAIHRQTALLGLVAVAVHGIALLGDRHLDPGVAGIAVPFVIDHARMWTGLGVLAGWLAAALGLSFWLRRRIGAARWRAAHRATLLVYVLSVAHTLGSGTDAGEGWMLLVLLGTGAPVLHLALLRALPAPRRPGASARARVEAVVPESADVTSYLFRTVTDGLPGQHVSVRAVVPGHGTLTRCYSLSAPGRISVKRDGVFSRHLHATVTEGSRLEVAGPSGAFRLDESDGRPVILISAGIGATPVLAMLRHLAESGSRREVWWLHGARRGAEHAFRAETRSLLERLLKARSFVTYSAPDPGDRPAATGRLTTARLLALDVPLYGAFHLCGPAPFLDDLVAGLTAAGVPAERLRYERFGSAVVAGGPAVSFARSGVDVAWAEGSLLELAEANGVAAPSGCRVGACSGCATRVLSGTVHHDPPPAAAPPTGTALLCCARPGSDLVLDV